MRLMNNLRFIKDDNWVVVNCMFLQGFIPLRRAIDILTKCFVKVEICNVNKMFKPEKVIKWNKIQIYDYQFKPIK